MCVLGGGRQEQMDRGKQKGEKTKKIYLTSSIPL